LERQIVTLGLVVEEGKLAMDPTKLKGILDWPAPKTVKEVQYLETFTVVLSKDFPIWRILLMIY
jgi:hypothetical protein